MVCVLPTIPFCRLYARMDIPPMYQVLVGLGTWWQASRDIPRNPRHGWIALESIRECPLPYSDKTQSGTSDFSFLSIEWISTHILISYHMRCLLIWMSLVVTSGAVCANRLSVTYIHYYCQTPLPPMWPNLRNNTKPGREPKSRVQLPPLYKSKRLPLYKICS